MATPRPINERVTNSYEQYAAIRPARGGIRNVSVERKNNTERTAARAAGTTLQATGVTMQGVGKVTKVAGRGAVRAGAALSSTGIGAVVGVPLSAVGGAAIVGGKVLDSSGKVVRRAGKAVSKKAKPRLKNRIESIKSEIKSQIKAASVTASIWSWAVPLWLTVQLPFAIIGVVMFGIASLSSELSGLAAEFVEKDVNDNVVLSTLKFTGRLYGQSVDFFADSVNGAIARFTGYDIQAFLDIVNPTNLYLVTVFIMLAYAFILFLAISFLYVLAGMNPILGRGAAAKILFVILFFVGYFLPLANMLPWFMPWTIAVLRHPK